MRAANLGKWFDCCVVGAHGLCHLNDLCVIAHSSALASPTHAGLLLDVCRIKRLDGGAIGTSSLGTEDRAPLLFATILMIASAWGIKIIWGNLPEQLVRVVVWQPPRVLATLARCAVSYHRIHQKTIYSMRWALLWHESMQPN